MLNFLFVVAFFFVGLLEWGLMSAVVCIIKVETLDR